MTGRRLAFVFLRWLPDLELLFIVFGWPHLQVLRLIMVTRHLVEDTQNLPKPIQIAFSDSALTRFSGFHQSADR